MTPHAKVFTAFYGLDEHDVIPCVICGMPANDLHHISPRQIGGSKCKDYPENLAPLCRNHHNQAEGSKEFNKLVRIRTLEMVIEKLRE